MGLSILLGAKYGVSIAKILYSFTKGDYKPAADEFLGILKSKGEEAAKAMAPPETLTATLEGVTKALESNPLWRGTEEDKEQAISEAIETLNAGFDFIELVRNYTTPEVVPALWSARRQSPLPPKHAPLRGRHDLLLKVTAEVLAPKLSSLPGFQNALAKYQVDKLNTIDGNVAETRHLLLGKEALLDSQYEEKYLKAVLRSQDNVELFVEGMPLDEAFRRQELTVAYVTLALSGKQSGSTDKVEVSGDSLIGDVCKGSGRVLVLGKAGSGKTTLLKWIAIQAALSNEDVKSFNEPGSMKSSITGMPANSETWRDKVPLIVRLRDWERKGLPSPAGFHLGGYPSSDPPAGWAERILSEGRGLLLLDGLDELSPPLRKSALDWICGLSDDYSNGNIIVASSRPQAVKPGALTHAGFTEFEVLDLSAEGRIEFVEKWHEAVSQKLQLPLEQNLKLCEMKDRILRTLNRNGSVAALASNPLICSLLCALNRFYQDELPKNLYDLCQATCKMLLWDRDHLTGLPGEAIPTRYSCMKYAERILVTGQLAYRMMSEPGSTLPRSTTLATIRTSIKLDIGDDDGQSMEVLDGLVERSNLLRSTGDDEFEFVHNSLRDFLAAVEFARNNEWQLLIKKFDLEGAQKWAPVIQFAGSTGDYDGFALGLLEGLTNTEKLVKRVLLPRQLAILTVTGCIQFTLPRSLKEKAAAVRDSLLPINEIAKAEALAEAGDSAIEFFELRPGMTEKEKVACARGLRRIGSERAREALLTYLRSEPRSSLFIELERFFTYDEIVENTKILDRKHVIAYVQNSSSIPQYLQKYVSNISALSTLTNQQSLDLSYTRVSDLSPLASLSNLQSLNLSRTPVFDLKPLAGLTNLKSLDLEKSKVSDITPIAGLSNLRSLNVSYTQISDLSVLAEMKNLYSLSLSSRQAIDFSLLDGMTNLHSLSLSCYQPIDLSLLVGLKNLRDLNLNGTHVSDLTPLAGMTNLQHLNLILTLVTDLSPLAGLTKLQDLVLHGSKVSAEERMRFDALRKSAGLPPVNVVW